MPARFAKTISESGYDCTTNTGLTPTDAYFCDFDGNWDANGDGLYGEYLKDSIDLLPEIFVGRLLVNAEQDVRYYTNKLVKYEINPGNGSTEYLGRAFLSQCDMMLYYHEADSVVNHIQNNFPDITVFSELPTWNDSNPTFPTGNEVIEELKSSTPGLMSFHGHGNPYAIGTMQNGYKNGETYGIVSKQGIPRYGDGHHLHVETAQGIDLINNKDFPAIGYSIACTVMPFDSFPDYTNYINFGKSFTSGGNYGGPAFISNTRYGYINYSVDIEKQFFDYVFSNNGMGCSHALSKTSFSNRDKYYYHCALTCNLLGCPEFEMWTAQPATIGSSLGNGLTVSNIDLSTNELSRSSGMALSSVATSWTNQVVTIRKSNHIPLLMSTTLQGLNLTQDGHYFVRDLTLSNGQRGGNVQVSGCSVGFEASNNIVINSTFIINSGADVTLISHGTVTINGGQINSGGSLTIYSDQVQIATQMTCASGGTIVWKTISQL